jgi:CheY-like chemotaxis protein
MQSGTPPRVLVVEDEFMVRLVLSEALAEDGFAVAEAGSADEALAVLQLDAAIELLLTDIRLPGPLDGLALASKAREQRPMLPVIFLTGDTAPLENHRTDSREVVLSKPCPPSEICAAARRLLDAPT